MNRRLFFKLFGGAVAGIAFETAIPIGRVWSFPKKLVIANHADIERIDAVALTQASIALQLEKMRDSIPYMYKRYEVLLHFLDPECAAGVPA